MKQKISFSLIIILILNLLPITAIQSFAQTYGSDDDGSVVATDIKYAVTFDGFETRSGYIEIFGSNLEDIDIRFDTIDGYTAMGTRTINTDSFLKYTLTGEEAESFTGKILINGKIQDISSNFPNLQSSDKKTVNIDDPQPYTITFNGNFLTEINDGVNNIEGVYGTSTLTNTLGTTLDDNAITLTNPTNPGQLGNQNITLTKTETTVDLSIIVQYTYIDVFRIIEDLNLDDARMYPNTGSKGDQVYITGENFSDTRNYEVYFVKALDGSDPYTTVNKAEFVSLALNSNGTEDILTVNVPTDSTFPLRSYYVVVTDTLNDQIVAEQAVQNDDGDYDQFTVIESGYKPTIENIYPEKGPDTGGNVQISGRNLITLSLPDLIASGDFSVDPVTEDNEGTLVLEYEDGTYKGETVSITRRITVQIGKKTTFAKDVSGDYQIIQGIPDSIIVTTAVIDDAETDPFKDVVIEVETLLEASSGDIYQFNQIVSSLDGFEYEPSSYTPEIIDIMPNVIQVEDTTGFVQFKNKTLLSIHGDKFLVDRYVDDTGEIVTHLPTVLIKKNDDNTFTSRYQLGFFPNESYTGGGETVTGIIKYKSVETDASFNVLTDSTGKAVPLDMVVLDDDGEVVDGTSNNQIGTKIVIIVPDETLIKDIGFKHLQITNPMRDSEAFGKTTIISDFVEFIKTSDNPVIESVIPNIITVEGNEEIVITGSNIQQGFLLYLDGEPITDYTRELDTTGSQILVSFTAPEGREGTTQLQIINPSGGMAVSDFTYVNTFSADPILTDFTPKLGSYDTLVVINGNNFLKPDPTVTGETGIDAYRLIGTRVLLDGEEVNDFNLNVYGNIEFQTYVSPDEEALIEVDADKAVYSSFYENVTVKNGSGTTVELGNDIYNNPAIITSDESYGIRYDGSGYVAYDSDNNLVGAVTQTYASGITTLAISGGPTFYAEMNNQLIRVGQDTEGIDQVYLADYGESVILSDGTEHFTISYNYENEIILSNGKEQVYTLTLDSNGDFIAVDSIGNIDPVSVDDTGITVDATALTMKTPYVIDTDTGAIEGHKATVLSKNQIIFHVPNLTTGKGYKDLEVVNPDTKNDGKYDTDGFYYVAQATSSPAITKIVPSKGSVDGGYYVTIYGYEFEDDAKVYIDSVLVDPSDMYVALDGTYITLKMPASIKDLIDDYGVDALTVPVVIVNSDGGNAYKEKGFTYIIPLSDPEITSILPSEGSSVGGEIVEILGYEFRYYEPYENLVGTSGYEIGDTFEDLYANGIWDNLLSSTLDSGAITEVEELTNPYYSVYYESVILPKVYFGEKEAKIVEYSKGYLKVITPVHAEGTVEVYVINNDSGVSNKVDYTYASTSPNLTRVTPNFGKRSGQEPKDIYGTKLYSSLIYGYIDNDETAVGLIEDVEALVRFGDIDNLEIDRTSTNSGLINSQRATVNLDGGLTVNYYGDSDEIKLTLTQNNVIYTKTFSYDDSEVYIPAGMLQNSAGEYFVPTGLDNVDATVYSGDAYEYIKVFIEDRRVFVERGYAPEVIYDNDTHVTVYTPFYYTIDTVDLTYTNPDGGTNSIDFTYTNPDSEPKILTVEPVTLSYDETKWLVESSMDGGVNIEVVGTDFRTDLTAYIGDYEATIKELTTKTINGVVYDLIVVTVPTASINDVDIEYPIIIVNEDSGIASTGNIDDLIGPNYGDDTLPFYFVYKKPLSNPSIDTVTPAITSIHGGNTITLVGSDFREGAYVVIGTRAGIPIYDAEISENGTVITFTTPTNMTLGSKTVQVINDDYGIGIIDDGLTVVSAPTVNSGIYDVDGNAINRVHVTGGQEIMITGTQFAENATVYFGGEWLEVGTDDEVASAEIGIYIDDSEYYVNEGYKATSVEFIDSETLIVTTPVVTFEGEVTLVVRNSDGGISDDSASTEYTVPIPEDPTGLKVTVINDQYIKLYDYYSEAAEYFQIYVYIGTKSNVDLTSNDDYKDFKYLGITTVEPYKINYLPGLDKMSTADRIVFVVKAVNKFGPSNFSNIAILTYEDIEDIEELGPTDSDGSIGVPEGEDYKMAQNGQTLTLDFTGVDLSTLINLDLSDDISATNTKKVITLPETSVATSLSNININFGKTYYRFAPVAFNSSDMKTLAYYYDAYAQLIEDSSMDSKRSYLTPQIRGKKQISSVYSLSFMASSDEETTGFTKLSGPIDFVISYEDTYLDMASEGQIALYKYDSTKGTYLLFNATLDTTNNSVTARITEAGHYVLLTNY